MGISCFFLIIPCAHSGTVIPSVSNITSVSDMFAAMILSINKIKLSKLQHKRYNISFPRVLVVLVVAICRTSSPIVKH